MRHSGSPTQLPSTVLMPQKKKPILQYNCHALQTLFPHHDTLTIHHSAILQVTLHRYYEPQRPHQRETYSSSQSPDTDLQICPIYPRKGDRSACIEA